jgi:hypothetical protein
VTNTQKAPTFQHGMHIPANDEPRGNLWNEHFSDQTCVSQELMDEIHRLAAPLTPGNWEGGPCVRERNRRGSHARVSRTRNGWRVYIRPRERYPYRTLGSVLGEVPFLFPAPEAAIDAAEVFIQNAHHCSAAATLTLLPLQMASNSECKSAA